MADILFSDVTNATTITDGTGYFDKLMKTVTIHIEEQYTKKRITGTEYANVYLQAMQSAMQTAQQFVLAEKLQEAQIDGILQDNLVKAEQIKLQYTERVIKDKEAAKIGLDQVIKTVNTSPELVYTPKYEEI